MSRPHGNQDSSSVARNFPSGSVQVPAGVGRESFPALSSDTAQRGNASAYNRFAEHGLTITRNPSQAQLAYLDALDKYYGTPEYEALLAQASKFLGEYTGNSGGLGEAWAHITGSNTNSQQFYMEQDASINDYLGQLGDVRREENRNSYSSQSAQMAAAGMNADLSGISNSDAGKAAEFDESGNSQLSSAQHLQDYMNNQMQLGGDMIKSFGGLLFQLPEFFQGIKSRQLDNALKELQIGEGADNWIVQALAGTQPVYQKDNPNLLDIEGTNDAIIEAIKAVDVHSIKSSVLRRAIVNSLSKYGGRKSTEGVKNTRSIAVQALIDKLQHQRAGDFFATGSIMGDPRYSDDFSSMLKTSLEYFNTYQKEVWDIQKSMQESQALIADDNARYNHEQVRHLIEKGVPEEEAKRQVAAADEEKVRKDFEKAQNELWDNVQKAVSGDKWYNIVGQLLVGYFRSLATQGVTPAMFMPRPAPQTTSTSYDYSNNTTNKMGTTIVNN